MRIYVFAIISFMFLYAGSCNKENIEGYIEFDRDEIFVNDSLFLKAVVTDGPEPYELFWNYWPSTTGVSLISPVPGDTSNSEYNAVFVSEVAGEFAISVLFLHRNTNPSESDSILIKVLDAEGMP